MRAQKSLLLWLAVGLVLAVGIAPQPARADAALPDKFLYAIAYTAPAGEFDQPEAVAVGADGTVYVADTGNHRIQRFTAEGELLDIWGSWGEGEASSIRYRPNVAPDGTVWVADSGNDRIQHFTARALDRAWGGPGDAEGEFAARWRAVGADGVVLCRHNNNRIQRFDADGDTRWAVDGVWGRRWGCDAEWNDFSGPEGVAVGPDGLCTSRTREESLLRLTRQVFLDSATDRSAFPGVGLKGA
jgi:hypothetical protein